MTKSSRGLCKWSRDDWLVSGKIFLSLHLEKGCGIRGEGVFDIEGLT